MTLQELGSLGEIIAALATIVTLIYLAVQIRQNTQSVRMSAETEMSHQFAQWSAQVVNNPDLGRIWDTAAGDMESLTDDEKRVYLWYVAELFFLYEGQFHLFDGGHIDEASWGPKADFMIVLLKNDFVSNWWKSRMAPFSNKFFDYIDARRESVNVVGEHKNVLEIMKQHAT